MNAPARSSGSDSAATFQASAAAAYSVATRVAGAVIALGYLTGLVGGPVVAVIGGLALMTYGRSLLQDRTPAAVTGGALAVLAASVGVAALRWEALDLGQLRGVQAVLGPTLTVGPTQAAVGTSIAAGAAVIALGAWVWRPWPTTRGSFIWSGLEAAIGAFALVTVFFFPAPEGLTGGFAGAAEGIGRWVGSVALVSAAVLGAAWFLQRWGEHIRALLVLVAGAAVAVGAALIVATG